MKILTVVGARPQFIKSSMLSKAIQKNPKIQEIIVHTGQHYDDNMSNVFFEQLHLPKPDYYLGVGSDSHGKQTAHMLMELESIMNSVTPNIVLVYGDTNSTLAGSMAAAKLHIPIAHVESGLRSYNKKMPEEINRVITDHLSHWLFCPSQSAAENLKKEGITEGVHVTGDIMYDSVLYFKDLALKQSSILQDLTLFNKSYYLATIHRAENTDQPDRLESILQALGQLKTTVVLPLHPRTKSKIEQFNLNHLIASSNMKVIDPLNYFDMLTIASQTELILTDSGGLQKEAYMLQVPCLTLRDETEWIETLDAGWNQLVGADSKKIVEGVAASHIPQEYPALFGTGNTAHEIMEILIK
ncbi:UDP-N-acetylglucosamine 2-epimerase (non-hydrolyzing) [Radiobacillus kanasensis]|uniref:non-hydrolyzing UDP-N-acetylglucosamine 2-epimerase n=1 Tax=Radiobacillus kanasensis TaxID=2844358 RepID=UPI001E53B3DC|nr:UDP-N-acetylglucosamine 2-epimerase (non-hydrolyzing) [Radiobacillus kanasensis]UFU00038.1 UDP-N-acetylglucosamine 2-epimerase (non-hydrolyzing) [Radiobacillus kanasensis]